MIIFDLNGDNKLETTNTTNGVFFDHDNDGFAEASAWVGENDGILVVDSNNNGKIDNGTEVLLHSTLAAFDTNNDGIIDANDADFNNLKILKGDGSLLSLADAGIISINLNTSSKNITDENGNQQFASGTFTKSDGSTGTFGEFLVSTDTTNSMATDWLDETADIENLPDINGCGTVYSLHQAMLRNSELKNLVSAFVSESNDSVRRNLIEQILLKWTNTNSVIANSRGENVNAQHLAILEKFMGRSFWSNYDEKNGGENTNPANPNSNAGAILEGAYELLKINIYAELMSQTHLSELFQDIEIEFDSNKQVFTFNLDVITAKIQNAITENPQTGKALAIQFVTTLKGLGLANYSNYFDPFDDNCLYTKLTHNDRDLKWAFDSIGKITYVDPDGEDEGTGADDAFQAEEDDYYSHFHGLTGDDVMYGCDGSDYFYACSGDDILDGGNGDDVLASHSGNDTIFGGEGNDIIQAAEGDDIIFGGDGDDLIYPDHSDDFYFAQTGNDIIRGDKGNDTIFSMTGDDTFIFNLGDGQDIVYEKQGVDTFFFGNGITWDDLIFEQVGNDMIIKINNTSDQITVKDWFLTTGENYKYDNNNIEIFEFADGSKHFKDEITVGNNSGSIIYNMSEIGDFVEIASGYKTIVNLKTGWNRIVEDLNSDDTFVFSQQGTYAQIENFSNNNTIIFGDGISLENIRFEINEDGLQISFDNFDGHLTIIGNLDCSTTFKFADNSVITNFKDYLKKDIASSDYSMGQTLEDIKLIGSNDISVTGNNLNNTIRGNSGNNTFEGKGGDDYIESKLGGNDSYIYKLGDGQDTISDIGGIDSIKFGEGISLNNISFTRNFSSNSLEIYFNIDGHYNDKIIIENYYLSDDNKIEKFIFSDGSEISDVSQYIYSNTYDSDFTLPENIHNSSIWGWNHVSATGNNLDNWFGANTGDNTFNGGLGNDTFWDNIGGNERYIYNLGDGNDLINDNDGLDAIIFGDGISKDNLIFTHDNNDLLISFNNSQNNSIRISNYFISDDNKIELLKFADGTVIDNISSYLDNQIENVQNGSIVMDSNQLNATLTGNKDASVLGNLEDNVIVGNSGNNVYAASGGDDTITDIQGGNDTYIYNRDSNTKYILDIGGNDTIKFGTGIEPEKTLFIKSNDDLRIYFPNENNAFIQIQGYFADNNKKIENFEFADGTVISDLTNSLNGILSDSNITLSANHNAAYLDGVSNASVIGSANDDMIFGNSGNNSYSAGLGNDSIEDRQGGDDTYIYNLGDGHDSITDVGGNDTLRFGPGISLDSVDFENKNKDLYINIYNNGQIIGSVCISKFFKNDARKIENIEFADGTIITDVTPYLSSIYVKEDCSLDENSSIKSVNIIGKKDVNVIGNSANNHFTGNCGNNTIEGMGGNDSFWDEQGGNDTYIFNYGDGWNWLHDKYGDDTIVFKDGITASDTKFYINGKSLEIRISNENGWGGTVFIDNYFDESNDYKIEKIKYADGTEITDVSNILYGIVSETENIILDDKYIGADVQGNLNLNITGNAHDNFIVGNA
ncbi:MAG: calcium-binding protein [Candidatus Gastranaerophilaceae bacterium]